MHSTIHAVCGQQKGQNNPKSQVWLILFKKFFFFFFESKGQGVISAFSKGQGITKRGQGAALCKRSLGRTLGVGLPITSKTYSPDPHYTNNFRSGIYFLICFTRFDLFKLQKAGHWVHVSKSYLSFSFEIMLSCVHSDTSVMLSQTHVLT